MNYSICTYVMKGTKNIFDSNFLASADIKAFGHTYLFAMLLLIDLILFNAQGVIVNNTVPSLNSMKICYVSVENSKNFEVYQYLV